MKAYFPRRIFWRHFWAQWAILSVMAMVGMGLGYFGLARGVSSETLHGIYNVLGPVILKVGAALLFLAGGLSLVFSFRSVKPLAQVIKRVRGMVNRKGLMASDLEDDDIFEEEGDFFELDEALNRVRRKLKKKYDQLDQLREESETLMMSMGDAVVSVDGHQRLVFFNSHFAKHFLLPAQAHGETHFSDVLRDPELLKLINRAISEGEVGELSVSLKSILENRDLDYGISISPLRRPNVSGDEGPIYGALVVFHDITHLKVAERRRIEFLSNVSHELRTPLTTVKGYVDLIKEDFDNDKMASAKDYVPVLSRNINRLVDLVNDLLLISKLEAAPDLQIEINDTSRICELVQEEFSRDLAQKGQSMAFRVEAPVIKADSVKLQQILRNLISNAIRYGPEKGRIDLQWVPVRGGIELRVRDQGNGISEQHQVRLFERFYRVDKGRSRELGGTGLGLAIVKHLMNAHRGTVQVKSRLGNGSEFICFFPQN